MENCNEVTNQNEGSSEHNEADYFELILRGHGTEFGDSTDRESPPIPPRKSRTFHCPLGRTTGKPRALPPPASSAIENDSILSNCDHFNQTPPLPAKSYKRLFSKSCRLVDKAVQCSPESSEVVQGFDAKHRVVRADDLLVVSTGTNIIFAPASIPTIVLAPSQTNEPDADTNPPASRTILFQNKATSVYAASQGVLEEGAGILEAPRGRGRCGSNALGASSRLALESLAPASKGCANEYVGDPVVSKKSPSSKKSHASKKIGLSGSFTLGEDASRKTKGLVCQKCFRCKCNQCRGSQGGSKTEVARKSSRRETKASEKSSEDARRETTKEMLVTLGDDRKIVARGLATEEEFDEGGTEGEGSSSCRRVPPAFLLQCFAAICCCSWKTRHGCCSWTRSADGCRCEMLDSGGGGGRGDDDVFLSSNS